MKRFLRLLIGLAFLFTTDAFAVLIFWDTNGTATGSGGPTPTGTWSADAYNWNTNSTGGDTTAIEKWGDGNFAVFAAGDDATGAYTVYVSNVVKVADIHVDLGTVTFAPDPVAGGLLYMNAWTPEPQFTDNTNRLLSVGHKDPNATAIYNVALTNAYGLVRYKRGTLVLGVTNGFTGPVTIEGGILKLGVPYAIPTTCPLVLANNDPARLDFNPAWQFVPAVFDTAGLNQELGPLKLAGTDGSVLRIIDLGNGACALSFADSSAEDWGGFALTITNFTLGVDSLRFGTSASGLTITQLGQITFAGFLNLPTLIDSQGYVAPDLPRIAEITHPSGSVQLSWTAVNGRTYRVWSKEALNAGSWSNRSDVLAVGNTASYSDPGPHPAGRFYRVEVLP